MINEALELTEKAYNMILSSEKKGGTMNSYNILNGHGMALMWNKEYKKSYEIFSQAIKSYIQKDKNGKEYYIQAPITPLSNRALLSLHMKQYDMALQNAELILNYNPLNFYGLYCKGFALLGLGRVDEAVIVLEKYKRYCQNDRISVSQHIDENIYKAKTKNNISPKIAFYFYCLDNSENNVKSEIRSQLLNKNEPEKNNRLTIN